MTTKYEIQIIRYVPPPAPDLVIAGQPLPPGERAVVDIATAIRLVDAGLALFPKDARVQIEARPQRSDRGSGIMLDGQFRYNGDIVQASWSEARMMIARGKARLMDGVVLPRENPDRNA